MHAKFGNTADTDDVYKFDELTVNFADFLANETNFSVIGMSAAGIAGLASVLLMLS